MLAFMFAPRVRPLVGFRPLVAWGIAVLGFAAGWFVGGPPAIAAGPDASSAGKRKVLMVGVDGLRPDALEVAETPHLDRLMATGSVTAQGRILGDRYRRNDTISGPGWSSILTGVWADKHGVHDNRFRGADYATFPHFFHYLKAAQPDAVTISLVSWRPIDQYIVSDADVRQVLELPGPGTTDLQVDASKLDIDTRDGQWHHLAGVRRGGQVFLYLDGEQAAEGQDTAGRFDLASAFYWIGRDSRDGATRFHGRLDNVRLWDRALRAVEIQAVARQGKTPDLSGCLADFRFETAGQQPVAAGQPVGMIDNTAEAVPSSATALGDAGRLPRYSDEVPRRLARPGNSQTSLQLDTTQAVQETRLPLPAESRLARLGRGELTVEAWFQTTDEGRNILLGNYSGQGPAINLELHTGNRIRLYLQPPAEEDRLARENQRDRRLAEEAARLIQRADPTALFVYQHQVDSTGHTVGFSPEVPAYLRAIEQVDGHLGTILRAVQDRGQTQDEQWLVIVCTDHGGFQRTHSNGHENPQILNVPIIVSGPAAAVGQLPADAALVDLVPTVLEYLRVDVDPAWKLDGRAIGLATDPKP